MNRDRIKKATFLLDEIGNVSDIYLQEAISYKKGRFIGSPWVAAVACLLAVVLIGGGLLNSRLLQNNSDGVNEEESTKEENQEIQIPSTLDAFLVDNRTALNCTILSEDELAYFGSTYLVLQYEGDETLYRSRELTSAEANRILGLVGSGEAVGTGSPDLLCRVWVVCEDGTVLTPYLKNTDGNKGYAVLFDYGAEILPSSDLISCISDILN